MALIDGCRRLVVTAAPGTGSTSVLAAFASQPGVTALPVADVADDAGRQVIDAKHATVTELIAGGLMAEDHGLRIVTTTRNPYDFWSAEWERTRTRWLGELRDRSSWVHRQPGALERIVDAVELDFPEWLRRALEPELSEGATRHLNPGHVNEADVVLRIERVDADLAAAGIDGISVGHLNRTVRPQPYWQHYSAEMRAAVEAVHGPDLERFGYRF